MAKRTGFLEYTREDPQKRPINKRIKDFNEFELPLPEDRIQKQAARCMDCGTPFCHTFGCPLKNRVPDWNDMVYRGYARRALDLLHATNNFPEFTGRVCPAPCEAACTLSISDSGVLIRQIELQIVERGWREGWINPEPAMYKTGKRVAIVGSGPAGLAAAQQLVRKGHDVIVFEKTDRIGGILRYGIPDFKLRKEVIDRRLNQMSAEGVVFETGVDAGNDLSVRYMQRTFNAIVIAAGSTVPHDLRIPGRELEGIHQAMEFLIQQNRRIAGDIIPLEDNIIATDKQVVVIGGGDTGSDCIGTCRRQGAKKITQIEILPKPLKDRGPYNPWPTWPNIERTSSSHEEGCNRLWSISTKIFIGKQSKVKSLHCVKLEWSEPDEFGCSKFQEIPGSEFKLEADFVLLAMGFIHVDQGLLIQNLNIATDEKGNIKTDSNGMTSAYGIFAAGDCVKGASLVAQAVNQGRQVAEGVDRFLSNQRI